MRLLWIGTVLVPTILSLTASEAAQESEGPELRVLESEAQYFGPVLSDRAEERRLAERRQSGDIDLYNVWTSFQKVTLKSNLTIVGHSYQICQDLHPTMTFASLVFAYDGPLTIRVEHRLSGGGGTTLCTNNVSSSGFWLLTCTVRPTDIRPGFYKVTSVHTVTSGGSGNGKETASFDMFGSC